MAATKQTEKGSAPEAAPEEPLTPSALDPNTHGEMLMLYRECADSVRFAKMQQWKTLAGTLLLFFVLGMLGRMTASDSSLPRIVVAISIALSVGAIYSLFIYQFWQGTERAKIALVSQQFSNLLRRARGLTSARESNIHRYVLLFFMIASILAGNALLVLHLASRLQQPL